MPLSTSLSEKTTGAVNEGGVLSLHMGTPPLEMQTHAIGDEAPTLVRPFHQFHGSPHPARRPPDSSPKGTHRIALVPLGLSWGPRIDQQVLIYFEHE